MKVSIIDYSLLDLVAVVSTDSERPKPNTFTFNFTKGDVAVSAVKLKIINQPWDLEASNAQEFRLGYMMGSEDGLPQYFTYQQMVKWIGGEDREAIVLNLAMQQPEISNQVLKEII